MSSFQGVLTSEVSDLRVIMNTGRMFETAKCVLFIKVSSFHCVLISEVSSFQGVLIKGAPLYDFLTKSSDAT